MCRAPGSSLGLRRRPPRADRSGPGLARDAAAGHARRRTRSVWAPTPSPSPAPRPRSARRTSPWSTVTATRSRRRRATCRPTRPSSPAPGSRCPRGVPRAGSSPGMRAPWRRASDRGSPRARRILGTAAIGARHAGRRRPAPGDAPGLPEHERLRHEPAAGRRGAPLRDPVCSRTRSGPTATSRAASRSRGGSRRPWPGAPLPRARVHRWTDWEARGRRVVARIDAAGIRWGAADPRRDSYAVAW